MIVRFLTGCFLILLMGCWKSEKPLPFKLPVSETPIEIVGTPEPWSFNTAGIAFQRANFKDGAFQRIGPLGDGWVSDQGALYLTFPDHDAVLYLKDKHGDLTFYGSESLGGKGLALGNPNWIYASTEGLYLGRYGQAKWCLIKDGHFVEAYEHPGQTVFIAGPRTFWAREDTHFVLYKDGQSNVRLLNERVPLFLDGDDKHLVQASKKGQFWYFNVADEKGRGWQFDEAVEAISDIAFEDGLIWLLIRHKSMGHLLTVCDPLGTVRTSYSLPFEADRFALSSNYILLINQRGASAEVFRRP